MRSFQPILFLVFCLQFTCLLSLVADNSQTGKKEGPYKKKIGRRELKKWQNGRHNYTSYRSFNPVEHSENIPDSSILKEAHVFRHNKNPMVGYLGIPVYFTTDKKHIKGGVHLGTIDNDETKFKEVYIPEHLVSAQH